MEFLGKLIISTLAVIVTAYLLPGVKVDSAFTALLGALIIIRPGLASFSPFIIFPLIAAGMYALYEIFTRIAGRSGDSFQTSMVYLGFVGWLCVLPFGILQWQTPQGEEIFELTLLAMTAIVGHGALILALMFTQASAIQPLNYLLIVFAFMNGFLHFGEIPDFFTVLGSTIIVLSGLFIIVRERIRARQDAGREKTGKNDA